MQQGIAEVNSEAPIGIFDSGVGGLTVAHEIMRQLPNEKIIYFGDTARVPYGNKSRETIIRYSRQIIRFLRTRNIKAIVVACNTASAFALEEVGKDLDIPIIGVVRPGAKAAAEATKNRRVGIIGTEGTINSQIYPDVINEYASGIAVVGKACPLFVPLVEEGLLDDSITKEIAERYLRGLREADIDTLILGCTHYPLIRGIIGEIVGDKVKLINPAYQTAISLKDLLDKEMLLSRRTATGGRHEFYVSDTAEKFKKFANSILPFAIGSIEKINIEEY